MKCLCTHDSDWCRFMFDPDWWCSRPLGHTGPHVGCAPHNNKHFQRIGQANNILTFDLPNKENNERIQI